MRKFILLSLTILASGFAIFLYLNSRDLPAIKDSVPEISPLPSPSAEPGVGIDLGANVIAQYSELTNFQALELIANFEDKKTANEVYKELGCQILTNAGFYSKQNTPLGLFWSQGKLLGNKTNSKLFDGFFYLKQDNSVSIQTTVDEKSTKLAFQSGPMLIDNSQKMALSLQNDEYARRIVAAKTTNGRLFFLVFYNKNDNFHGPLLADLPQLVTRVANVLNVHFLEAINLDGGSASAFITPQVALNELSPVGSFLCGK